MQLAFVTGNSGKFNEIAAVLPFVSQTDIDLDEIQSLDPQRIIEHKLLQAAQQLPGAIIVEDTSLEFTCLNGLPGTNIKWFLKCLGNDGLAELVHHYADHSAVARCTIGLRGHGDEIKYFSGEVSGTIVAPRGALSPFGWNSIFQPDGHAKTFAEMSIKTKNAISMRGQAARQLRDYLSDYPLSN